MGEVLVVDDEAPMRHMLRLMLEREGFGVRDAGSGTEALALVDAALPDVVLTGI